MAAVFAVLWSGFWGGMSVFIFGACLLACFNFGRIYQRSLDAKKPAPPERV